MVVVVVVIVVAGVHLLSHKDSSQMVPVTIIAAVSTVSFHQSLSMEAAQAVLRLKVVMSKISHQLHKHHHIPWTMPTVTEEE